MSIQSPSKPGARGLRSSRLLLTVQLLATVGLFGADLVLVTFGFSAVLGADPGSVYPAAQLVASTVVAPLALISLATGVVLARLSGWGLFRYWWVTVKLGVTLLLTIVVFTVLVPRLGSAAAAASAHASFDAGQRVPLALAPALATLFLVLNVALAVYKPHWRVRRGHQQVAATSLPNPTGAH
jgi:hypothetical protein